MSRSLPKISDKLVMLSARLSVVDDFFGAQLALAVSNAASDLEHGRLPPKFDLARALRILAAVFDEHGDAQGAADVRALVELVPKWRAVTDGQAWRQRVL